MRFIDLLSSALRPLSGVCHVESIVEEALSESKTQFFKIKENLHLAWRVCAARARAAAATYMWLLLSAALLLLLQ